MWFCLSKLPVYLLVFLEVLQAAKKFSKASLHFTKIPNSLRQILETHPESNLPETVSDGEGDLGY